MFQTLSNGILFHYETWGKGSPSVVFIAGYTGDIDLWRPIAEVVAKQQHQVLIFDNQGIGKTQDHGEALTCEAMAKNTVELYTTLKFNKPIIAGFAMGSNVAQAIAIHHPDKLSGLVLLNPVAKWSENAKQKLTKLIELRYRPDKTAYYEYLYHIAFGPSYKQQNTLETFIKNIQASPSTQTEKDERRQLAAMNAFDSSQLLTKIAVPTLVLAAEHSEFVSLKEAQLLTQSIGAHATCRIIANSGHNILRDQPSAVQQEILKFIAHYKMLGSSLDI